MNEFTLKDKSVQGIGLVNDIPASQVSDRNANHRTSRNYILPNVDEK